MRGCEPLQRSTWIGELHSYLADPPKPLDQLDARTTRQPDAVQLSSGRSVTSAAIFGRRHMRRRVRQSDAPGNLRSAKIVAGRQNAEARLISAPG